MKKGILILLIFLAAGCQHKVKKFTLLGEGTPYVVYPEILNGRIQTIEEKSYWVFPHKGRYIRGRSLTREERMNLGGWSDDYKAVFDSSATLQICEALSESGQPEWKNEFIKVNNLITRTNYFFHDTLVFYHCFQYSSNGKMISGKSYLAGVNALLGTARIRTNENGYPVEISNYTAQGEPANTIKYTYDQKNRFIQFVLYNIKGKAINSHEAKYNRKNKIAEFVFRDENHQVLSTNNFIYQYDKRGNWIRAIVKISRGQEKWFIIEERSYTYYPLN